MGAEVCGSLAPLCRLTLGCGFQGLQQEGSSFSSHFLQAGLPEQNPGSPLLALAKIHVQGKAAAAENENSWASAFLDAQLLGSAWTLLSCRRIHVEGNEQ